MAKLVENTGAIYSINIEPTDYVCVFAQEEKDLITKSKEVVKERLQIVVEVISSKRLEAIKILNDNGIFTGIMMNPVLLI